MSAVHNVPGVYLEEASSLRLSVTTGATAVPAFVCAAADLKGTNVTHRRFNSWLAAIGGLANPKKEDGLYRSLQIYFENGGGYCYAIAEDQLDVLDQLDDVTLLVQADSKDIAKIAAACTKFSIFGIYNATESQGTLTKPSGCTGTQGAVYGPSLTRAGLTYSPSAAVAGVYCRVDRERGVWKAPANVAVDGGYTVAALSQEPTVESGVNAIRSFNGGAPLVWGARTTAPTAPLWNFVPVRRLFNSVEKDIKKAMSMAVFEPNNAYTWETVRGAIDNYLHQLWVDGALLGTTPAEAYSVLIGLGATMTDDDLVSGRMRIKVGLAAVRPAEQIILHFSQKMNGA